MDNLVAALFLIWSPSHIFVWEGWSMSLHKGSSVSSFSDCDTNTEEDYNHNISTDDNIALPKYRIAAEKLALLKSVDSWLKQSERIHRLSLLTCVV